MNHTAWTERRDNTEGAIAVLDAAADEGVISIDERNRQTKMLKRPQKLRKHGAWPKVNILSHPI